ncbi:MAG: hypothetical protein ABI461_12205 [Polyangiaceae bacterium]
MTVRQFTAQCADDFGFKVWSLAFLALSSCSSSDDINGNLGKGTFAYQCVSVDDPACPHSGSTSSGQDPTSPANFPAALAEGAHFKVGYTAYQSTAGGNPTLKPVAPEYIQAISADGSFTALKAGKDALVARSSVDSLVFDYTVITISPISSLGVTTLDGASLPGNVSLSLGSTASYLATALGPRNEKLAGAIDYTWSSNNPKVVKIEQGNPTAHVDVDALSNGDAIITVTQGTMSVQIPITVAP